MSRSILLLVGLCLWCSAMFAPEVAFGAGPEVAPTESNDARLARYFAGETRRIAAGCLNNLTTKEAWLADVPERRRQLAEMLGIAWPLPRPEDRSPLSAEVMGTFDQEFPESTITVERLHFQSLPGLYVTANLYRPKVIAEGTKLPAILYVCGHGLVKKDGVSYGNKTHYQHHGIWYARNGYVCLVIDTIQLGELEGLHHGTYRFGQWWWNSLGYTPAGVETWNGIRALDYLATRPEVDMAKVGLTGRSGGGAYSWYLAAIDERIAAAVPTAGITDLENHVVDGVVEGHCDCMYLVNTYEWDYADVAALVAPRPLLISNTDKDGIFPLEGVVRVHEKTRRVYRLLGVDKQLGLQITEGGHNDTQELHIHAFRWFNRFLKGDEKSQVTIVAEKPIPVERLKVFDQPPADEKTTTWQTPPMGLRAAASVPATQAEFDARRKELMAALKEKVFRGWPDEGGELTILKEQSQTVEGVAMTRYDFLSQPDVPVTLWLAHREGLKAGEIEHIALDVLMGTDERELRAIYQPAFPKLLGDLPPGVDASPELWQEAKKTFASVKWGQAWLAPRGVGPNAWSPSERKQSQIHRRFMLLGQTPDGMRVWDTIASARLLREKPGMAQVPLRLSGCGNAAVVALYAALFMPGVTELELLDLPASHARSGPDFLNVAAYTDIPETLAFVSDRTKTMLFLNASAKDDEERLAGFARQTAAALGWKGKRLQVSVSAEAQAGPGVLVNLTYNGQPVQRGELAIYPQGDGADGVPWLLALDRDGAIPERADGLVMPLPVGPVKVAIRDAGGVPHKFGLPDSTPLTAEIVEGENRLSFSIKD
jgi:hypothetical protein